MSDQYDVFISYSRRRDILEARRLAEFLHSEGFRVWFDEGILNRKQSWRETPREEMKSILTEAINASSCVILFAIEQNVIAVEVDLEKALRNEQVIRNDQGLIVAWNWQIFEMKAARHTIVIYERRPVFEIIMKNLTDLGISPSNKSGASLIFSVRNIWTLIYNRFTKRRRVSKLIQYIKYSYITDDQYYRFYLYDDISRAASLAGVVPLTRECLFITGERGVGMSVFLRRTIHLSLKNPRSILLVLHLPAAEDTDLWKDFLKYIEQDCVIVIEDLVKKLSSYSSADRQKLESIIGYLASKHNIIITHPFEDEAPSARELIPFIWTSTREIQLVANPDRIRHLICWYWGRLIEQRQIKFNTESYDCDRIAFLGQMLPIFSNLLPVNYKTLEGTLLSEPTKSITIINLAIQIAQSRSDPPVLTDNDFDEVMVKVTGFSKHFLGTGSAALEKFECEISFIAVDLGINPDLIIDHLSWFHIYHFSIGTYPGPMFCVRDFARRRNLASNLAEAIFGSKDAVIIVNFDLCEDQIVNPSMNFTDTFRWLLKAVKRFPYWVVVFENANNAAAQDKYGIKNIVDEARPSLSSGNEQVSFENCVIIFDHLYEFTSLPRLTSMNLGVVQLD